MNWLICGILTSAGVLSDDPSDPEYKTRTDARSDVIYDSPWFNFPYPGNFCVVKMRTINCAAFTSVFCPGPLLLLAPVIRYRDPGQNVRYHFTLLCAALDSLCIPHEMKYSQTSVARTSLGPWKFVREMGSSSQ